MTPAVLRWSKTLALLLLACVMAAACGGQLDLEVGQRAPDLTLPDAAGQRLSLSDLRGQVVLLNFWATWCEPCKEEMPVFQSLWDTYREAGLAVVLVSLGDEPEEVSAFIHDHGYTFHALVDTEGQADRVYMTNVLPSTFLIDPQGILQHLWIGPVEDEENVARRIVPLFSEQMPTSAPPTGALAAVPASPTPTRTPAPSWTPSPSHTWTATPTPTPTRTSTPRRGGDSSTRSLSR